MTIQRPFWQTETGLLFAVQEDEADPILSFNGKPIATRVLATPEARLMGRNLLWNADFKAGPEGWVKAVNGDYAVGLNLSEQRTLSGGNTLFIKAPAKVAATKAYTGGRYSGNESSKRIAIIGGMTYEFSGLIGTVQCAPYIEMVWFDGTGQRLEKERQKPETFGKSGGTRRRDYKQISCQFTAPAAAAEAALIIGIDEHSVATSAQQAAKNVAVFVSEPQLFVATADFLVSGFLADDPEARSLNASLAAGDRILACTLAGPGQLQIGEEQLEIAPTDTQEIPDLDGVAMPAGAVTVPVGRTDALFAAGSLGLSVDGIPVAIAHWSEDQISGAGVMVTLRIPGPMMDGRAHALEVTSRSGDILHAEARVLSQLETDWFDLLKHTMPPHDGKLAPIAGYRMRALEEQLKALAVRSDAADHAATLHHCYKVLERGFPFLSKDDFKPLRFEDHDAPTVSIILPAHNKVAVTYSCLASLLLCPAGADFEVILIDDGSSDETATIEDFVSGLTVIRHSEAQGFQGASMAGADKARGLYLVFLNNDTEVTPNWLGELLWPFEHLDTVGATGAKLIYPDGRLQDAGGVVRAGGKPWNYGRLKPAGWPQANYTRDVDYLTGAALMVKRTIWEGIEGFSPEFAPAYYEDTDLAFKIRAAGFRTVFAPKSVVIHYEGISHGRDQSESGSFKQYQALNAPKFEKKWAHIFGTAPDHGEDINLIKDRNIKGRVLFIDNEVPRPDYDAGSYAAVQEMRMFQGLGYKVSLLPANRAYLGKYTEDLQRMGVEVLFAPYVISLPAFLEKRGGEYDYIFMTRYYVAQHFIQHARLYAPQAKILFNNADCHFLREMRAALIKSDESERKEGLAEAQKIRSDELAVMRSVDLNFSYNDAEIEILNTHLMGDVPVEKMPWVQEAVDDVAPAEGRDGVMFLGGFGHKPNVEAVEFLAQNVMPLLRKTHPEIILYVYGSRTTEAIKSLEGETIRIMGQIPDVKDAFNRHRLFLAPLLSGAGIKGKVLSAMAHGIPCLLSPIAAEGIDGIEATSIIEPRGDLMAERIIELLSAPSQTGPLDTHQNLTNYSLGNAVTALQTALSRLDDHPPSETSDQA